MRREVEGPVSVEGPVAEPCLAGRLPADSPEADHSPVTEIETGTQHATDARVVGNCARAPCPGTIEAIVRLRHYPRSGSVSETVQYCTNPDCDGKVARNPKLP